MTSTFTKLLAAALLLTGITGTTAQAVEPGCCAPGQRAPAPLVPADMSVRSSSGVSTMRMNSPLPPPPVPRAWPTPPVPSVLLPPTEKEKVLPGCCAPVPQTAAPAPSMEQQVQRMLDARTSAREPAPRTAPAPTDSEDAPGQAAIDAVQNLQMPVATAGLMLTPMTDYEASYIERLLDPQDSTSNVGRSLITVASVRKAWLSQHQRAFAALDDPDVRDMDHLRLAFLRDAVQRAIFLRKSNNDQLLAWVRHEGKAASDAFTPIVQGKYPYELQTQAYQGLSAIINALNSFAVEIKADPAVAGLPQLLTQIDAKLSGVSPAQVPAPAPVKEVPAPKTVAAPVVDGPVPALPKLFSPMPNYLPPTAKAVRVEPAAVGNPENATPKAPVAQASGASGALRTATMFFSNRLMAFVLVFTVFVVLRRYGLPAMQKNVPGLSGFFGGVRSVAGSAAGFAIGYFALVAASYALGFADKTSSLAAGTVDVMKMAGGKARMGEEAMYWAALGSGLAFALCLTGYVSIAWARMKQTASKLPFAAALAAVVFDVVPGLSMIPFVTLLSHAVALIGGLIASKPEIPVEHFEAEPVESPKPFPRGRNIDDPI